MHEYLFRNINPRCIYTTAKDGVLQKHLEDKEDRGITEWRKKNPTLRVHLDEFGNDLGAVLCALR